ncbi:peptide methionine sulfoxide reductase [Simiduia agarivorans SA1 = DSM 21679]|uniref:Peptide methionine sulfoxide reductase MsrA n=2 Tax=Simiduia TaxID=447467 RepID=K4KHN4_SIMAS|nr:peptide methionine sulfoxide reductase [Simiduia agarivorans SA1 = DSM 21679]
MKVWVLFWWALALAGLASAAETETAVFAGGCFWCMEKPFDELRGVKSTQSGYMGGKTRNPTYEQVSAGGTGHAEVVEVVYDPAEVSFEQLLTVFWRNVDPFDGRGQFCDKGSQYRPAIFPRSAQQAALAQASLMAVEQQLGQSVAVTIETADTFYPAEQYHQNYYQRNPVRYKYYRYACGRDQRLREVWGEDVRGEKGQD